MEHLSKEERDRVMQLALGRIFRLASRPAQPGDVEEYERCRRIIMTAQDPGVPNWTPNYARDWSKGG